MFHFLGAEFLYEKYPDLKEGDLSKIRSRLLSGLTMAEIARELNFQDYIKVQEEGDKNNSRLLAGTLEAFTATIYLKGGMEAVKKWVRSLLEEHLEDEDTNYKSQLQEWCQKAHQQLPVYKLVRQEGKDHNKTFSIEVFIKGKSMALAKGFSKRKVQQEAAKKALKKLEVLK